MSRLGKTLLIISGLALVAGAITRLFLGEWEAKMWIPLGVFAVTFIGGVAKDFRFFRDLMLMRTTKHGLNMGTLVLLVIALLGVVNFVGYRHNKKWDLTEEKLNSLSDQTITMVQKLNQDLEITGFFTESRPEDEAARGQFRQLTKMIQDEASKVQIKLINPLKKPDVAKAYKVDMSGVVVFKYGEKQTTVTDLTEEAFANAIVKITREKNKILYVLKGHGELDMDEADKELAAGRFIKALRDSSYNVNPLSLLETGKVPEDADAILILGATQPLLETETQLLLNYAANGGRLFIAMDPGKRHNLGELTRRFGISFGGDYIIDQVGQMLGLSAAVAVGTEFSKTSEISKNFQNVQVGLLLASSLKRAEGANPELKTDDIVRTTPATFSKRDISGKVKAEESDPRGPFTMVMSSVGKGKVLLPAGSETKDFSVVVVSSSSLVSNQFFDAAFPLNRDLALNAVSSLAKDTDLITVRPKEPKGTRLVITRTNLLIVILAFFIPLPLLMFGSGFVVWLRRRGA